VNNLCTTISVSVTTLLTTTGAFQYENFDSGHFSVEASGSPAQLTWYTSHDGTTYRPAYDEAGTTAITQSVTKARSYAIPSALAGAKWLKAVDSTAACTLNLVLKG
jgi:hypothetical protein